MKADLSYVHVSSFLQVGPWCVNHTDIVHLATWQEAKDKITEVNGYFHLLTPCRNNPWNICNTFILTFNLVQCKNMIRWTSLPWMLLFFTSCAQSISTSGGISFIVWPWKKTGLNHVPSFSNIYNKASNSKQFLFTLPLAILGKHVLRTVCPHETWMWNKIITWFKV